MLQHPNQQNRMQPNFRPPVVRLQSPFNRQGAKLKKTLFISDLLHRQVTRQFLGDFLFSFITNINIQPVKHPIVLNLLSLIYFLLLIVFGTFIDWKYLNNNFTKIPKGLEIVFHPSIFSSPGSIFLTPPFYIQIAISLVCLTAYIGMLKFYFYKFLSYSYNLFIQYLCILSFPFCLFSVTNFLYSLILITKSSDLNKNIFLINIILPIFCIPALVICMFCVYADTRISVLPFTNVDSVRTEIWIFLGFIYSLAETLFFNLGHNNNIDNYWVCSFLFLVSFIQTFLTFYHPFYLNLFPKIMASVSSFVILAISLFSFIECFTNYVYLPTIAFCFSMASIAFSIAYHLILDKAINKRIKESETVEITQIQDFYQYYSYCRGEDNFTKLAKKDLFNSFESAYPTKFSLQILILRYLMAKNDSESVFETSVNMLKALAGHFYYSLQLTCLIEESSEIIKNSKAATNIRHQQLDCILEDCIQAQINFWRAVLLNRPKRIKECSVRLFYNVKNAHIYFNQLNVDLKSEDQFAIKYIDFLMNISVELVDLEDVTVDASKPIPYDQRFAMHQPRRDTRSHLNIAPQPSHFQPFALKPSVTASSSSLEAFPCLDTEENRKALIAQDRIDLCRSCKNKRLEGENVQTASFFLIYSLLGLLSLIVFLLVVIIYSLYTKKMNKVEDLHHSVYTILNCATLLLNYKTSDFYNHTYVVPREEVEKCLNQCNNSIQNDQDVAKLLNVTLVNSLVDELYSFIDFQASGAGYLVTSPIFYTIGTDITIFTYEYLLTLEYLIQDFSTETHRFRNLIHKLNMSSIIIFVILIPFFFVTYGLLIRGLKKLFWQPILIDKAEAANVFQAFSHLSTPEKRKSNMRNEQFNRDHDSTRSSYSHYGWMMSSIVLYFLFQFIVLECFLLIFDNRICDFSKLSYSFGNTSTVMVYLSSNLYRFIPLSYTDSAYRFGNWFAATLETFRKTSAYITSNNSDLLLFYENVAISDNFSIFPVVNQTLGKLESLPLYPLPNTTVNQLFHHSIISTYMVMSETFIVTNFSYSVTRMKDLIHYDITAVPFFNETFTLYNNEIIINQFVAIFILVLFVVLEALILGFALQKQIDLRNFVNLFIRTIILLPDSTPLVSPHETEIHFYNKMPDSPTMKLIEALPVGIIMTDKNGLISYANPKATEYFGDGGVGGLHVGDNVADLRPQVKMRYFSVVQRPMNQFPKHPFDVKLPKNEFYYVYIYNEITELNLNKIEHEKLQTELREMKREKLPSSITATRKGQKQNVIMMDTFAMVEATFSQEINSEDFANLKKILQSKIEPIPTVFLSEFYRDSIVIIFSSFNVVSHQRQFLRDALRCAQLVSEICGRELGVKVAVTSGTKCICKIVEHEQTRVSFYAPLMTKAEMLLRFGIEGDIIVEWNIMKTISGIDQNFEKLGSGLICNKDVDFCIISSDDNLLKTFFGTVSAANLVFS